MALLPVYYTTTNLRKRKSKKTNTSEHDRWLSNMGLTPKQIKAKKSSNTSWKSEYSESLKVDRSTKEHDSHSVIAGPASAAANRSIMANLHKESEETRASILEKAARVMPLYNKGGLQLLSPKDDLTTVGTKSRR